MTDQEREQRKAAARRRMAAHKRARPCERTGGESRSAPCKFVGAELTGAERARLNLSHARTWTRCDHPQRVALEIAEAVCRCQGCGPKCPGYAAG